MVFSFLLVLLASAPLSIAASRSCPSLASSVKLSGVEGKVLDSRLYRAGQTGFVNSTSLGQSTECQATFTPEVDVCRVAVNVTTSYRSSSYIEIWLPSDWNGRILSTGDGGLAGCVDYANLQYTTSLGFAATGDNGGHDGSTGIQFYNNADVIVDFSYRSRHSAIVVGKQILQSYYGKQHKTAYHFACSTGGRQGLKAAQMYPEDYDGIVAGSPASDFNHLCAWSGHFLTLTGQNASDPRFLSSAQWQAVNTEVFHQCDLLDGVADMILEDSSICAFNPETLLCTRGTETSHLTTCLTETQVQTVRNVFSPLLGVNNTFLYPRLSPSAEAAADQPAPFAYLNGNLEGPGTGWFSYAVYNDLSWDPTTLNALDVAYADSLDAEHGYISSFSGDLSKFRDRGGKLIQYHGMSDPIITGEQSMRYYTHVANTMKASNKDLDKFYRFFRISGMGHCSGGNGAWAFGQIEAAQNASTNVLWEVVNWVEKGIAPDTLVGTKWVNDNPADGIEFQRAHCRYPYRTTFKGGNPNKTESWGCDFIENWDVCGGPSSRLPILC